MTEVVQSTPPQPTPTQPGTGPFAAIRQHFEKHGTIYLIILGAAGLFVAVLVWQNNQGSGSVPVGGSTAGTNPVDTGANQADLNSILAGIEGQSTQLQGIQTTLQNQQNSNRQVYIPKGANADQVAQALGLSSAAFDKLAGAWSAFVANGGSWAKAGQGGFVTLPPSIPQTTTPGALAVSQALQPKTAGMLRTS